MLPPPLLLLLSVLFSLLSLLWLQAKPPELFLQTLQMLLPVYWSVRTLLQEIQRLGLALEVASEGWPSEVAQAPL